MWYCNPTLFFKTLLQSEHGWGGSEKCVFLTCLLQFDLSLKLTPHSVQIYGSPSKPPETKSEISRVSISTVKSASAMIPTNNKKVDFYLRRIDLFLWQYKETLRFNGEQFTVYMKLTLDRIWWSYCRTNVVMLESWNLEMHFTNVSTSVRNCCEVFTTNLANIVSFI